MSFYSILYVQVITDGWIIYPFIDMNQASRKKRENYTLLQGLL